MHHLSTNARASAAAAQDGMAPAAAELRRCVKELGFCDFKRKMLYDNPVRFYRFSEGDIAAARKAKAN